MAACISHVNRRVTDYIEGSRNLVGWIENVYLDSTGLPTALSALTPQQIRDMSLSDYAVYRAKSNYAYMPGGPWSNPEPKTSDSGYNTTQKVITAEMVKEPMSQALAAIETAPKPEKKLTYSQYYWKYVNASDGMVAAEAFANMIDSVTVDMEPNEEMSSWLEEPRAEVKLSNTKVFFMSPVPYIIMISVIYCTLGFLGIIH
jgi:hypothetical protein